MKFTVALADLVGSATLIAVTKTEEVGTVAGGVYTPAELTVPALEFPPVTPFTCHAT